MRFLTTLLLTIFFSLQLFSKEYTIHLKKGWQLIGLPITIDNLEPFNNGNIRLIWSYSSTDKKWLGFSPETDLRKELILQREIPILSSIKRWHGIWVYSYNDWTVNLIDNDTTATERDKIPLYSGWNLLSLPIDVTVTDKLFQGDRVWKYEKESWKTNGTYSFIDFDEVDELNPTNGFWVYSDNDKNIDISSELEKINSFNSVNELDRTIKQSLMQQREDSQNISISGSNSPDSEKYRGKIVQFADDNLFFIGEDRSSIKVVNLDDVIKNNYNGKSLNLTPAIGTLTVEELYFTEDRVVVISSIKVDTTSTDIENSCRSSRTQVSILELDIKEGSDSIEIVSRKDLQIDGEVQTSRTIDKNLYLVTAFSPCANISYPKIFLTEEEDCFFSSNESAYNLECSDVYIDSINSRPYREDLDNPYISDSYTIPQVWKDSRDEALIKSYKIYSSPNLSQSKNITTISHINILSGEIDDSISMIGTLSNMHISDSNIYLFSNIYGDYNSFDTQESRETFYKLSYYPFLEYRGYGSFNGELLSGDSITEIDKTLIVASKERIINFQDRESKMELITDLSFGNSVIERILFFGNKAVMTTQQNELYTLDISNVNNPIKVGATIISGETDFLEIIEDDKLLTVGREVIGNSREGVKMELFNISKFSTPKLESSKTVGDYYNYTPVTYNRDTFDYYAEERVFSIPIGGYGTTNSTKTGVYSYGLYSEDNGETAIVPELNGIEIPKVEEEPKQAYSKIFKIDGVLYSLYYQSGNIYVHQIDKLTDQ